MIYQLASDVEMAGKLPIVAFSWANLNEFQPNLQIRKLTKRNIQNIQIWTNFTLKAIAIADNDKWLNKMLKG